MILLDVNVLVYAHKTGSPKHAEIHQWLLGVVRADEPYGLADLVLSSFIRVVTHPRIFDRPSTLAEALDFARVLRSQPNCVLVQPGPRHWEIFTGLCEAVGARGNIVADAWLAALAVESGSEWITTDRDFARFPGLRWRPPVG